MANVLDARRKSRPPHSTGPEYLQGIGPEEDLDVIEFLVDLYGDGTILLWMEAAEADYTGLIAEWVAGSATTILESAMQTEIQAFSFTDRLSATQRANVPGKAVTWPAP